MLNLYESMLEKRWLYKVLIINFILMIINFSLFAYGLGTIFYGFYYGDTPESISMSFIIAICSAINMGFNIDSWSISYNRLKEID